MSAHKQMDMNKKEQIKMSTIIVDITAFPFLLEIKYIKMSATSRYVNRNLNII